MTRKTYGQLRYFGGGLSIGWSKRSASKVSMHLLSEKEKNDMAHFRYFNALSFDPPIGDLINFKNVIRTRRLGVRPKNALNLIKKGRFKLGVRAEYALNLVVRGRSGDKNSKQPPNHRVDLTDNFPFTNRICDNCQNIIRTRRLGVRPETALHLVKKGRFGVKNSKQPQNHHVAVTDSFPLTNGTCDN
ncbi:hypothetical protein CsSME_00016305 [Camellia sinensis var. sinensis]